VETAMCLGSACRSSDNVVVDEETKAAPSTVDMYFIVPA